MPSDVLYLFASCVISPPYNKFCKICVAISISGNASQGLKRLKNPKIHGTKKLYVLQLICYIGRINDQLVG